MLGRLNIPLTPLCPRSQRHPALQELLQTSSFCPGSFSAEHLVGSREGPALQNC